MSPDRTQKIRVWNGRAYRGYFRSMQAKPAGSARLPRLPGQMAYCGGQLSSVSNSARSASFAVMEYSS